MGRPSSCRRVPVFSRSVVEPAVTPGPVGKVCESIFIEELEIIAHELWLELADDDFQGLAHVRSYSGLDSIRNALGDLLDEHCLRLDLEEWPIQAQVCLGPLYASGCCHTSECEYAVVVRADRGTIQWVEERRCH